MWCLYFLQRILSLTIPCLALTSSIIASNYPIFIVRVKIFKLEFIVCIFSLDFCVRVHFFLLVSAYLQQELTISIIIDVIFLVGGDLKPSYRKVSTSQLLITLVKFDHDVVEFQGRICTLGIVGSRGSKSGPNGSNKTE